MAHSTDDSLERLERQLEGAERALSAVAALSEQEAERVAQRMDRLASQLLRVSQPPSMDVVHQQEGTEPARATDFERLARQMGSPDGEG
ncbi:MAG: hypothetical protein WBB30_09505 [Solirubrobacterales bacterium]